MGRATFLGTTGEEDVSWLWELTVFVIHIPFDPALPLLGRPRYLHQQTFARKFLGTFLKQEPTKNTTKYYTKRRLRKWWYFYVMEYYAAVKLNEIPLCKYQHRRLLEKL